MDSFYDAPRRPPAPISRETLSAIPVVPEISVLCSSNSPKNAFTPYYNWKHQQNSLQNYFFDPNKENINGFIQNPQNNSILKKQVRFESPVPQTRILENKKPDFGQNGIKSYNRHQENVPSLDSKGIPSFEHIYMANIPNRQLDLSIIDLPRRSTPSNINKQNIDNIELCQKTKTQIKENEMPKNYKEFLETQKNANNVVLNDSVKDIFNYKGVTENGKCLNPQIQPAAITRSIQKQDDTNMLHMQPNKKVPVPDDSALSSNNLVIKNDVPNSPKKYFESVSQTISQRVFPTKNYNLGNLKPLDHVKDCSKKPNLTSSDGFILHNRLIIANTQDCAKSITGDMKCDLNPNTKVRQRSYEAKYDENKPSLNEGKEMDFYHKTGRKFQESRETNDNAHKTCVSGLQKRCDCCMRSSNVLNNSGNNIVQLKSDDDFSAKDLLKIIAQQSQQISQQNNQLLLLQQQVSELVSMQKNNDIYRQKCIESGQEGHCCHEKCNCINDRNHYKKIISKDGINKHPFAQNSDGCIEKQCVGNIQDRCITSTQHEMGMQNKNNLPNFSIGLTTSFEVSFRRHSHRDQNDFQQKNTKLIDFNPEPPRIQEITETESTRTDENDGNDQNYHEEFLNKFDNENYNKGTLVDASMVFREPIRVTESCPSPEPSIKINMNDFDDSDSDDSSNVEASFYRNLMAQVNNILQKAKIQMGEELAYNKEGTNLNNKTMHKVKEATLKHLKRIGVDLPSFEESLRNSSFSDEMNEKSYNQDDVSFAVKQLLMKYLPAEHLAKLVAKEGQPSNQGFLTPKDKTGAIKKRPEFSFATVQYMKKYNLIANSDKDLNQPQRQHPTRSPKILDISKLKQQPKLL